MAYLQKGIDWRQHHFQDPIKLLRILGRSQAAAVAEAMC